MNQNERDTLGLKLTEVAMLYGKEFPKEQISIYINTLISFVPGSLEVYIKAINDYVADSKNIIFPAPIRLKQYIEKKLSPDATANEVASRIRSAISKFGWPNPDDAKKYIGDLGWKVVERAGGWSYLCENLGVDLPVLTFHAQARDLTKSMIENNNLGNFDEPIYLDQYKEKKQIDGLISNLIKTIEG